MELIEYLGASLSQHQETLGMWIIAALGAFGLYWISRLQSRQPASLLLILNVDVLSTEAKTTRILADMIISSLVGALLAMLLANPSTYQQAFVVGFGWTGLASLYTKEMRENA